MGKMLESQKRLDRALACPGLANENSIKPLVEKQLLRSPFSGTEEEFLCTLEKRTTEVSDFLDMLRSASRYNKDSSSGSLQSDWKVKQETDQLRVMYREGPPGTPFHTLLCEGYVDGPIDSCLCVSWESALYQKWWPQYSIPTFKITFASSLQKVRIGEEILIVRVKVPWPMSDREALLQCFEVECFEEDLVIVHMNSVSETKGIDTSPNGFRKAGIPDAENIVRIDVVGGFALQKVGSGRSYFRGIANMDIKVDFVPPSLINFLSRQLIGNGHKLYSKAVAAVTAGDQDYQQALKGAMYARIRENLYTSTQTKAADKDVNIQNQIENTGVETLVSENKISSEIIEEHVHGNIGFMGRPSTEASLSSVILEESKNCEHRISVSMEVQQALSILDKAITIYRNLQSSDSHTCSDEASKNLEITDSNKDASDREGSLAEATETDTSCFQSTMMDINSRKGQTPESFSIESNTQQGIVLQQTPTDLSRDDSSPPALKGSLANGTLNEINMVTQTSVLERVSKVFDEVSARTNATYHSAYGNDEPKIKRRDKRTGKARCCWSFL